jgi:hypothetical protein
LYWLVLAREGNLQKMLEGYGDVKTPAEYQIENDNVKYNIDCLPTNNL